jgi:hypothetical protein
MADNSTNSSPPLLIPDHELIARVGAGSYGEIWLARSLTGSFRAVKIIFRDRFKDARPFEREFRGILSFEPISRSHPGVVSILHVGQRAEDGYFYYVMEVADDLSAGQRINPASYTPLTFATMTSPGKPLAVEKCIDYGLALTAALAHFHQNGLAHRDIKPSNIIFVNGRPKLADIGLVADISGERSYLGTHGYIPPEGAGSSQADLYSLGKVLYEAASGNECEKFPELPDNISERPDAARFFEFNEILLKACAPESWRRYESAQEMHRELEQLKNGASLRGANARKRRARRLQWLAAAAFIAAASTVAVLAWQKRTVEEAGLNATRHSPRLKIPVVKITAQPASGTVLDGSPVALSLSATGEQLRLQWFRNGQPLAGETNQDLRIPKFTAKDVGRYTAQIGSDLGGKRVWTEPADWAVGAQTHEKLLNIQFTAHLNIWHVPKRGPAAVGASNDDVWNIFSRDGSPKEWRTSGSIEGLKWSDGTDSRAKFSIQNIGGMWFSRRGDPLLRTYVYPAEREGQVHAKISNLPAQEYDIYVYAHGQPNEENSEIEILVNGMSLAKKATTTKADWAKPGWSEGVEYVLFRNVKIPAAGILEILISPGNSGLAVLNGIQIVKSPVSVR